MCESNYTNNTKLKVLKIDVHLLNKIGTTNRREQGIIYLCIFIVEDAAFWCFLWSVVDNIVETSPMVGKNIATWWQVSKINMSRYTNDSHEKCTFIAYT